MASNITAFPIETIKRSELPTATTIDGADKLPLLQGGINKEVTAADIKKYVSTVEVVSSITSGTITPAGNTDLVRPAALTAALTIANPSSTPADGWGIVIELIDDGTARALTWGSKYSNRMAALPTTTTASKRLRVGVEYHAADDKLYCMYAQVQP